MTLFKIPRVGVYLPNATADRVKFVPEYDYPIFKRVYNGRVADPAGNPVRIVPHPKENQSYKFFWHEVEADDIEALVAQEASRLRQEFGMVPDRKTGEPTEDTWFDTVYHGDSFRDVVEAALKNAEKHEQDANRADPADKILALCAPLKIDRLLARKLATIGWHSVEAIAGAEVEHLSKYLGKVNAALLIKAANKELDNLIDATPAEQIAAAKGKNK